MDGTLILKGTLEQVEHDLSIINEIAAAWWASQGYTIIETEDGKAIVGKNAATGMDNPSALTTKWAEPELLLDTTDVWFIPSPSADKRFIDWKSYLPEGVSIECEETYFSA